ncbi:CorA family divalent cation transporter [Streptomyces decoyicus]|uniref:CorA family divalent cation transporter n=1 Tax=Streptomyces decoyicus TaxID=249567 RepID=UPI0033CC6511
MWIGLHEPTEDQLQTAANAFALRPLAVEDAPHAHQRPKLERYDDTLFLVLRTAVYVEHDRLTATSEIVDTGEIMAFTGADFIVAARHARTAGTAPHGASARTATAGTRRRPTARRGQGRRPVPA